MGWLLIQTAIIGGIFYWAGNHTWPNGRPSDMAIGLVGFALAWTVTFLASGVIDLVRSRRRDPKATALDDA